jgi:polysaccharide biosynthesis/export protein
MHVSKFISISIITVFYLGLLSSTSDRASGVPRLTLAKQSPESQPVDDSRIQTDTLPGSTLTVEASTPLETGFSNTTNSTESTPELPDTTSAFHPPISPIRPSIRPPAQLSSPLDQIDQSYTLGAGDVIQVNFFNVPEYSGQQIILVDGSLNFPALGRISVAGMTLAEAETAIATQYASALRHPQVTITLVRARPLQLGIVGEVSQPGLYTLSLTQDSQFPTVAQVIQTAGGTTQSADLRQIKIRRPRRVGSPQLITINLWEFLQNGDLSQDIALRDGDTVIVPATSDVNLAETAQLAASNLASSSQTLDVAMVGEVFRPGAYKLTTTGDANGRTLVSGRPTLTRALQVAGGITSLADLRRVAVRRTTRAGGEQVININLWQLLQSGDLSQDLVLQQGDTITVPTATALTPEESVQLASANIAPESIRVNVVGEVRAPGTIQVSPNTTLNQAILTAGGLSRRAQSSVELIRLNPNGTVMQQTIRVDLSQSINPETNPVLRNSDSIVVGRNGLATVSDVLGDVGGGLVNSAFLFLRFLPGF